jgi:hypothetical protein
MYSTKKIIVYLRFVIAYKSIFNILKKYIYKNIKLYIFTKSQITEIIKKRK